MTDPSALITALLLVALAAVGGCVLLVRRASRRSGQLVAAAERYAAVIESATDAVITVDRDQRIVVFNAAAERLLGCRRADVLGTLIERFIPPAIRQAHATWVTEFGRRGGGDIELPRGGRDVVALHADGHEVPVEASISTGIEPGSAGRRKLFTVVLRDISERKRAEAELRSTQASLIEAQRIARLGYFSYDVATRTWSGSPSLLELAGQPPGTIMAGNDVSIVHPDDRQALQRHLQDDVFTGRTPFDLEFRILRGDNGEVRWVHVLGRGRTDARGRITHLFGSVQDVTERRLATQALERQREELRRLSAALTDAREQERRHVARELHDELGQRLSALKLDLSTLLPQVGPEMGTVRERLRTLLGEVDEAIAATRRIATNLRPAMLDDLGLTAAIEWLATDWARRAGLKIDLDCEPIDDSLDESAATAIYRIVQEGLTNVHRHAAATAVRVELHRSGPDLVLRIVDDGHGLAPGDTDKRTSSGLTGIRERARILGGSASLHNGGHKGCVLEVRLPLERVDSRPVELQEAE